MAKILLYNMREDKLQKLCRIALWLGLEPVAVPPEDFHKPLGNLLYGEDAVTAEAEADFPDEMLVMEELSSPLLDALRREGVPVALKAVVTEQNRRWSSAALCRELRREHEAMRSSAPKRPVHPHKKRK